MSRYQALRKMGCGWFTSSVIAAFNRIAGVPAGEIRFMHITIEYSIEAAHGIKGDA